MTDWINELTDEAREPDTLARIIDSMRGVIELMESALPVPTMEQLDLIWDEVSCIRYDVGKLCQIKDKQNKRKNGYYAVQVNDADPK